MERLLVGLVLALTIVVGPAYNGLATTSAEPVHPVIHSFHKGLWNPDAVLDRSRVHQTHNHRFDITNPGRG